MISGTAYFVINAIHRKLDSRNMVILKVCPPFCRSSRSHIPRLQTVVESVHDRGVAIKKRTARPGWVLLRLLRQGALAEQEEAVVGCR
jgi:hypothetical protein